MNFFEIEKDNQMAVVWFNRPKRYNLMTWDFWQELPQLLQKLKDDRSLKVVIFAARGKHFSAGLDLADFQDHLSWLHNKDTTTAEKNEKLHQLITNMQNSINAIEELKLPTIAAVQGYCIGGGLDFIAACDIRVSSANALFSLREAKVHIVADMGSLQRLPAIIGEGNTREMALSARDVSAQDALRMGLVSYVFADAEELYNGAKNIAQQLCQNSALVMKGIKDVMNYGRNHNLKSSLEYAVTYNAAFLQSHEFMQSLMFLKQRNEQRQEKKQKLKINHSKEAQPSGDGE